MSETASSPSNVPTWRLVAGGIVLLALVVLGIVLTPIYLRNLRFQHYVEDLAERSETRKSTDETIRANVVEKAGELSLPVHMDDVHVVRATDSLRVNTRYVVHVNLLVYAVDLHFYPGAGSR